MNFSLIEWHKKDGSVERLGADLVWCCHTPGQEFSCLAVAGSPTHEAICRQLFAAKNARDGTDHDWFDFELSEGGHTVPMFRLHRDGRWTGKDNLRLTIEEVKSRAESAAAHVRATHPGIINYAALLLTTRTAPTDDELAEEARRWDSREVKPTDPGWIFIADPSRSFRIDATPAKATFVIHDDGRVELSPDVDLSQLKALPLPYLRLVRELVNTAIYDAEKGNK